jgi:hypothetical protein
VSTGGLILAAAIPLLFLHVRYQPDVGFDVGGTHVGISLSDLAVAGIAVGALVIGGGARLRLLRPGLPIWIASGCLLAVVLASVTYPVLRDEPYDWHAALVSALKFCEYAALALAVPLLVRRRASARWPLRMVVLWSVAATGWGILQFTGAVNEFEGKRPGQREPSFLGIHDLAALSGAALVMALTVLAIRDRTVIGRRWAVAAGIAGGIGVVLSGALTAVIGMWLATLVLAAVAHRHRLLTRRAAVIGCVGALLVTAGTAAMRGSTLEHFAAFLGLKREEETNFVESYPQRTLLGYIGLKIWLDEPITGVGFLGSSDQWAFQPQLAAAHRRFPNQPEEAFPSPGRELGVQNFYIETLADLGVIGFATLVALFAAGLVIGLRGGPSPLPLVGVAWLLVAAGVWNGLGIVPGIPLAALTWLALGLVTVRG